MIRSVLETVLVGFSVNHFLVFDGTVDCHLNHLLLASHFPKVDLLLLLGELHEGVIAHEGEGTTLVGVSPCSAHPMNICSRADLSLALNRFTVVDDQSHRADIDSPSDGFSAEQHLDLFVSQSGHPRGFAGRAILRVHVFTTHLTDIAALSVNVVDVNVCLACVRSSRVIDDETTSFFAEGRVEDAELRDGVEKDNNLWFRLELRDLFEEVEDDAILVSLATEEVSDAHQSLVLVFGI